MGILRVDKLSGLETPTPVTGSVLFDGTGDYLAVTPINNSFVNWWQSDFTIEAWIYADSYADWWFNDAGAGNDIPAMVGHFEHDGSTNYWSFGPVSDNTVKFYYWKGSQNHTFVTSDKVVVGEWSHIAMTYSVANGAKLFINGRGTDYISLSGTPQADISAAEFNVGQYNSESITGYVSNLRILNGTALYTSNFTPPVHELEVIGDTVLLCCNNPDSAGADGTGKTITVNGDAAASTFSPGLTRDFTSGTEFNGVTTFDTQGYFVPPSGTTEQRGRGRGIFGGGSNTVNTINYITIASMGNAFDFGDLTEDRLGLGSAASSTRALFGAGYQQPSDSGNKDTIDFVTIATTGNAINFGDLVGSDRHELAGASSSTRALFAGGSISASPNFSDEIDYVTIASLGNAQDFGNLTVARRNVTGVMSPTRAVFCGGRNDTPSPDTQRNEMDYVTIASTGNAIDFGDLTVARGRIGSVCSSVRGVLGGGELTPGDSNVIDFMTIATTGNAQDFGDMIAEAERDTGGCSNSLRGVFGGQNVMQYITIATTGDALDFGDLLHSGSRKTGCSDSHGGIS